VQCFTADDHQHIIIGGCPACISHQQLCCQLFVFALLDLNVADQLMCNKNRPTNSCAVVTFVTFSVLTTMTQNFLHDNDD